MANAGDPGSDFVLVKRQLPYAHRLQTRALDTIDLVVIHCTELPDLGAARKYGERIHYHASGTGNSGHYYIDRDGTSERWMPDHRVAHHVRGFNERSIGVELVNLGRYPNWLDSRHQQMTESYPDAQINSLCQLLKHLGRRLPRLQYIAGHEDLDKGLVAASDNPAVEVRRKRDPGVMFPWEAVLSTCALERISA